MGGGGTFCPAPRGRGGGSKRGARSRTAWLLLLLLLLLRGRQPDGPIPRGAGRPSRARGRVPAMKPPRMPDPRKLLAGLAVARTDGGLPALDEHLQEVERRLQCRARQTRERRLRKLMGPPEAPAPRALSLRAMEQIRYLRSAFPEEWPAGRLAQGFGVTPEVIRRVLKSRFRPSPERGLKQDARAGAHPSPAPICGAAPGVLEPPAGPGTPPGLSQEGAAASRARLPGLLAGGRSVAAGRRPEGARGSAGKAGKARAPRSLSKEAPGEGPEGPAAS